MLLLIGVVALAVAVVIVYIKGDDVTQIGIIWVISVLIVDTWVLFQKFIPGISETTYNLWWDKDYNEPLNALWYIAGVGAYLSKVLFVYGASKLASLHSLKLHKVSIVFVGYYVTQFAFWLYNKNTSVWANFLVHLFIVIVVPYLLIDEKKTAKYRRIDS
ncbi:MAG: hypothetical protein V4560_14860 [Bacteroidota bacterium]